MDYEYFMTKALQQAETALAAGEFPVGCVMVHADRVIATGAREGSTGDCTSVIPNILRKKSLQLLKAFFANPANTYLKGSLLAGYTLRQ